MNSEVSGSEQGNLFGKATMLPNTSGTAFAEVTVERDR